MDELDGNYDNNPNRRWSNRKKQEMKRAKEGITSEFGLFGLQVFRAKNRLLVEIWRFKEWNGWKNTKEIGKDWWLLLVELINPFIPEPPKRGLTQNKWYSLWRNIYVLFLNFSFFIFFIFYFFIFVKYSGKYLKERYQSQSQENIPSDILHICARLSYHFKRIKSSRPLFKGKPRYRWVQEAHSAAIH